MKTKQQLNKEFGECLNIYVEENKRIGELSSSITEPLLIEKFTAIAPEIKKSQKKMDDALAQMAELEKALRQ